MRRGFAAIALVFVILAGVGIGVASYNAGKDAGQTQALEQVHTAQQNGQEVQVVHVVNDRGFIFPGFFFFPFLFFGFLFLVAGIMRGAGRWGHGGHGPGPWNEEGRRRFEEKAGEWHRQQHGGQPPSGTPPSEATPTV
ncbi:MAG TPA: hypothetical protein VLX89_11735 [Actinomycetota bacterium]|nr:hypothetical protein [Actinomycetota bacterium]